MSVVIRGKGWLGSGALARMRARISHDCFRPSLPARALPPCVAVMPSAAGGRMKSMERYWKVLDEEVLTAKAWYEEHAEAYM